MESPLETQTQNQPQTRWQRSTTRRFFAWLFSWRTIRRCLFAFAVLVTLVAVVFTIENIRGKRTWDKYRAQMAAQGENLDWRAYVPKPIPDDQNFAASPYLVYFMQNFRDTNALGKKWPANYSAATTKVPAMRTSSRTLPPGRRVVDLAAYAAAFEQIRSGKDGEKLPPDAGWDAASRAKAAGTIIEHMKLYQPVMDELRQASLRPGSRFNLNYEQENPATTLLPHLAEMKRLCQAFRLHASAHLALGHTDQASQDIQVMLRISEAIENEPFLISHLVQIAIFRIATDAIWEGLLEHKWSDAQLQQFQARLQPINFVAAAQQTLRGERAFSVKFIEFLRTCSRNPFSRDPKAWEDLGGESARTMRLGYGAMPSGWLYLEEYHFARLFNEICSGPANPDEKRVDPARARLAEEKMEQAIARPWKCFFEHSILSRLLLPALGNALKRTAEAQAVVSQATLACALERYRLAKGEYPEQLAALTPNYIQQLPHDPITGSSLIYQKNGGEYILYSVAWDGKDDGGLLPSKSNDRNKPHDWVWSSSAHLSNR